MSVFGSPQPRSEWVAACERRLAIGWKVFNNKE
jgi:hypothetical protein